MLYCFVLMEKAGCLLDMLHGGIFPDITQAGSLLRLMIINKLSVANSLQFNVLENIPGGNMSNQS